MTTPLMYAVQAAALWSGLLILMMLVLSGIVVSGRRKHMVSFGDGGNADLMAASRAFGNCVEYATPGMAAMAVPLRGRDGSAIGCLSIAGPAVRMTEARMAALAPAVIG